MFTTWLSTNTFILPGPGFALVLKNWTLGEQPSQGLNNTPYHSPSWTCLYLVLQLHLYMQLEEMGICSQKFN